MLKAVLDVALPVLVILMMTMVGLRLTRADFLRIWRQPSLVCVVRNAGLATAIAVTALGRPVLVLFADGQTQQWLLVRLEEPKAEAKK